MVRFERLTWPGWHQLISFLKWDWARLVHTGWHTLWYYFGLAGVGWILYLWYRAISMDYVVMLLPGFASVLLLHPFLNVGSVFIWEKLPRQLRYRVDVLPLFAFTGVIPRFVRNLFGLLVLFGALSFVMSGVNFLMGLAFWGALFGLVPGVLGWGFLISSFGLLVNTSIPFQWGLRRLMEVFGAVFIPVSMYPERVSYVTRFVPHRYLNQVSRTIQTGSNVDWVFLSVAMGAGLLLLFVGFGCFIVTLSYVRNNGRMDRGQ